MEVSGNITSGNIGGMEQLYSFLAALAVGIIVALVGYFLNISAMRKGREEGAKEQLSNSGRGILSELKANLEIAGQPFQGRLIPFVTSMFSANAGEITKLPNAIQNSVYQAYFQIDKGNAIVQTDLHKVAWGGGYLDNAYKEQCKKIMEAGKNAERLLETWLEKRPLGDAHAQR